MFLCVREVVGIWVGCLCLGREAHLYFPAPHEVQTEAPAGEYVPAAQLEQTEDSSPVAPLLMYFPAGQL